MGKKLIITEKPSVAMDFARVLRVNSGNRKDGFLENDEYVISWCYGHLVQMVYPEDYDIKYKKWNLKDLPFLPDTYKYGVVENAKNQYLVVNSLLHRDDIETVYWAGDSGKEGQTIEENIRMYGGVRDGMTELRVWIDSQTDEEMLKGIKEAKPMSDYLLLGKSGVMRTIEDYALGINFSRALSVKYGNLINDAAATSSYTAIAIGRVMTCVLGMVVDREREIRNFNETPFFKVKGYFSDINFPAEWRAVKHSVFFESPLLYGDAANGFKKLEDAQRLIDDVLLGHEGRVISKDISSSKKKAPLLFNLAELQAECSKRFKISPAQTLDIIQKLYERKMTTYPRTDARVLTTAVAKEISKNLRMLLSYKDTAAFTKKILDENKYSGIEKTQYTDDSKVTDHYAIIPTGQISALDSLNDLEKRVYDLIVRRFLSIFYPPAEYKNIKMTIEVNNESFFASSKILMVQGYLEITGIPNQKKNSEDGEEDKDASSDEDNYSKEKFLKFVEEIKTGDEIAANNFAIKEGKTSPPKRYTSGNLILAMENAGKLLEDEELREQIKTTGIGTSATRGEIIDKLIRIGYLNLNNKSQIISPEKLGEMIYEVVNITVPSLLSPEVTASWEKGLEGIVNGSVDDSLYRKKLEDYIRSETNKMISSELKEEIANRINPFTGKGAKGMAARKKLGINCPLCGGELTTTPFGYGCSNYFDENKKCRFNLGTIAGVDIEEEEFRKLITEGRSGLIKGFKGKNSKNKFDAILLLNRNEDGEISISFDFSESRGEVLEGVSCPACGSDLIKTSYGVACQKRLEDKSCYFSIGEIASKKISYEDIKQLLTEGSTKTIRGFKSKNKKNFDACLVLKENEEGKKTVSFDFDNVEAKTVKDLPCPICGKEIIVTSFGYRCCNYSKDSEEGCKFSIGQIAGLKLKEKDLKELVTKGITQTISGFKSKKGSKFDARLMLDKEENGNIKGVRFVFENDDEELELKCPKCGSPIIKGFNGFRCQNNEKDKEDSCSFYVGKVAGVVLSKEQFTKLIEERKTDVISGFLSKKGLYFDARLKLDDENKVVFEFEQFNGS